MSIIVMLLFVSLLMGVTFLIFFIRAVRGGQFSDTTTPAMRMLTDDDSRSFRDWKRTKPVFPAAGNPPREI